MKNKIKYINQLIQKKAPDYGRIPSFILKTLNNFWIDYLIEKLETTPINHYIILDINKQTNKTEYIYTEDCLILTNPSSYFAIKISK